MGVRQSGSLLVQTTYLLHDGGSVAEPNRVAASAEDDIGQAPMRDPPR
jgi:hypothetical protein